MNVTVNMTIEEFQEFCQYRSDKTTYSKQLISLNRKMTAMAQKVTYAIEPDPKKPHKYKIVDQDHLDDLCEYANDILASL